MARPRRSGGCGAAISAAETGQKRCPDSFFLRLLLTHFLRVKTVIVQNIWDTLQRDIRLYQVSFPEVEQRLDAPAFFGEIYITGCPIIFQLIPCCVWDILIYCSLVHSTNHNLSCSVKLDLDLLKPWRVSAAPAASYDNASPAVKHMSQPHPMQVWLEYAYSKRILSSSGCPPSLQSGLPTTCRTSWDSLTRQIPEGDGRLLS